jgi:hypothetical protein
VHAKKQEILKMSGQYKDSSDKTGASGLGLNMGLNMGWINELARAEVHPDAERLLSLGKEFDPTQMLEESTVDFLTTLRRLCADFCKVFNAFSAQGTKYPEVKLYGIAHSAADFMIFRNQIKLLVSSSAPGTIQVSFSYHQQNGRTAGGTIEEPQQLTAVMGPFRNIYWTFKGEKIEPDQVSKFYFSEFVRLTRSPSRSKSSNHLLFEQLKTLLEEKGLDF